MRHAGPPHRLTPVLLVRAAAAGAIRGAHVGDLRDHDGELDARRLGRCLFLRQEDMVVVVGLFVAVRRVTAAVLAGTTPRA